MSTLAAAVPVVTLLVLIASARSGAYRGIIALVVANIITIAGTICRQHVGPGIVLGVVVGFFPIG